MSEEQQTQPSDGWGELRETEGVPLVLPNEATGPARGRNDASLYTGNLGSTGLNVNSADVHLVLRRAAVLALALLGARLAGWGTGGRALAVLVACALDAAFSALWPRWQGRQLARAQERNRQRLLAHRYRRVPDSALSGGRRPDSDRGLSRREP